MNVKNTLSATVALLIGLAIGYFIFGKSSKQEQISKEHVHTDQSIDESVKGENWTCSMHPQIRQNESGQCPLCGMDLIKVSETESDDPLVLTMTEDAVALSNIQTSTVGGSSGSNQKTIVLSGKIQADERNTSSQVAHIPGRIERLNISFTGEYVRKGQSMATIYSPELITAQRELIESKKLANVNARLLLAARNKLKYWKISEKQIQKIEDTETIQETFEIYADASGVVTDRMVAVGDYIKVGQPMFGLVDLNRLWVLFDAYERDLPNITIGNLVEFTTTAVANKTFAARVTFIDPFIDPSKRTASIRAEVNNKSGNLKPEMLVSGRITNTNKNVDQLTVPKSAVLWTGKRSIVYVKVPDTDIPSFQYRQIEIGERIGDNYIIESGLEVGEEIVTYGSFSIDAAAQLNNQSSMMNQNVKVKKGQEGKIEDYSASTPDQFKGQLHDIADAYMVVKEALVNTDAAAASHATRLVMTALEEVDDSALDDDAKVYWKEQSGAMMEHIENIAQSTDVKEQRIQFEVVSEALINSIQSFGTAGEALFVIHCPMAFNNDGADWLAAEKTVRNPYFGDKMMKCGVVKKTL